VIVGANKCGQMLANKIRENPQIKMEFLGYFDDRTWIGCLSLNWSM
jgi:putative colanic acid biosynthesis UDP-glucose lipid carrier transferase